MSNLRDIPKLIVAVVLFVVILFTFVVTIRMLGQTRYFNPPPETVYLDLGSQNVKASVRIIAPLPQSQPQQPEVPNG